MVNEFKQGFSDYFLNINVIINILLLSLVYLSGVGLTTLLSRLLKKKFINSKTKRKTYWNNLNLKKEELNRYYRQF
ncbi:hypothetical protein GF327_04325 [Candidatus Woesearchaeota archaeon]|nr:hypothetical protein [Candidatus Woesearchaeota archaeon]